MWFHEARKIYVVPLGKLQWWLLEEIGKTVQDMFKKESVVAEEMPIPSGLVGRAGERLHSTSLMHILTERNYNGMVLGVTDYDLYVPALSFVFGESDPVEGVAVVSIARLKGEFYGLKTEHNSLLERSLKEAFHEMGHLYGLRHCRNPVCVMYHSSTIKDTDGKFREFCGECKLRIEGL